MNLVDTVWNGVRDALSVSENLKRLALNVDRLEREVRDQDRRLIRVEAFIEMGLRRGPPRLTDE